MAYQPIEDHGIIGNLRTAALVGKNGSIDWFCFPRFDSPSVFGAILDDKKGGFYRIFPVNGEVTLKQVYWPDTNILITRFLSADGAGEVIDFMPIGSDSLIRMVKVLRGSMRFRLECYPAFNYGRDRHKTRVEDGEAHFSGDGLHLGLLGKAHFRRNDQGVTAELPLPEACRCRPTIASGLTPCGSAAIAATTAACPTNSTASSACRPTSSPKSTR